MANTMLKPETIVRTALGILQREIMLPGLVTSIPGTSFKVAKDDTVTYRIPAVLTGREYAWRNDRSSEIVVDDLTETKVDVTLNHDLYSAVKITDEELTLDIVDFAEQVLNPQIRAVAEKAEGVIATALSGATYAKSVTFTEGSADADGDPYKVAIRARKHLNDYNVPKSGRVLLVGSSVEAAILDTDHLVKANESGTDSALREATIGRLAGFTVVQSNSIDEDAAYAMHPSAVVFGNIAPAEINEGARSATQSYGGMSLRWLQDYDSKILAKRSVVSTFAGATAVADGVGDDEDKVIRAVKINFVPAGS